MPNGGLSRRVGTGSHRFNAAAAHDNVAILEDRTGFGMDAGTFVHVQFKARIRSAVDRKRGTGLGDGNGT